ncbi:MAG: protein NO VEIN domain-containing protein, partial [Limisphaerales bacterium]
TDGNGQNSGNNVHITTGKKPDPPNGPDVGNPPGTQKKDPLLNLKDPNSTPYELRNVDKVIYGSGGSGGGYGGGGGGISTGCQNNSLSEEEKKKLEQTAREFAKKALKEEGYPSPMDMPSNNPGYDILAEKENEKLHIEVKAHIGFATVVEITMREYLEFKNQNGYRWELWNIENLAEDDKQEVVITRYKNIPDEAIESKTFRVDLKKCS